MIIGEIPFLEHIWILRVFQAINVHAKNTTSSCKGSMAEAMRSPINSERSELSAIEFCCILPYQVGPGRIYKWSYN